MEENNLEKLKKERDEYLAGWQRAKADFANYKKEEKARMHGLLEYAREEFLASLLPTLDNLERAEKELKGEEKDSKLVQGFLQIARQFKEFLKREGVREIDAEGKEFDPALHEAVGQVEGEKPGKVAEVLEKGYMIKDTLLRPAKVKVGK